MRKRTAESTQGEENRKMQIASPKPKEEGFEKEGDSQQWPSPKELKAMRSPQKKSALVFLCISEQARCQPALFSCRRAWDGWSKVKEIAGLIYLPLFLLKMKKKRATGGGVDGIQRK